MIPTLRIREIKLMFGSQNIPNLENEIRWYLEEPHRIPVEEFVARKLKGEPLAYILGNQDFMGIRFVVSPAVLIPRRETEEMVECIEKEFTGITNSIRFADIGSGSGCIGLSLAKRNTNFSGDLIEVSKDACAVIEKNRKALALENKTKIHNKSAEEFFGSIEGKYNMIVANPPYIDESDPRVDPMTRKYEPHLALFADNKGLDKILAWQELAFPSLMPDGKMFMEIGHFQGQELKDHFAAKHLNIHLYQDLQGRDRWIKLSRIN